MAGKLSFSIAINLLTENFKRGTSGVKNGLRAIQMQVLTFAAALGAGGIGLSGFVSQLINVARETSRVTTALKNVSGGLGRFADNQRFAIDMAKKYGLEVNALTGNFAKFTAASEASGMSMVDQRKIFESVSRACTAFGMSADDSNGVFLALSQMMSKGKISSEELRLQMGERLPIALQAMAKAAGVSVAGLDKLMKQGKLMSKDVLPRFADALNEMIPNVDTDNLETSVNRLKNAFTEFTKGTNIQSAYKGMLDWLTGAVRAAGENIKGIVNSVVAFIIGVSLGRMFKWIIVQLAISQRAAMLAAARAAKAAGVAFDAVAWKANSASATIGMAFSRMGKAIKTAFISALPTAILLIVSELIAKFVTIRQEAKRIGRIFSDYKSEAEKAGNSQDVVMLKEQLSIMNDKKQSQDNINGAQAQLQKMLGVEHRSQKDLNALVAERVKLLEEAARAQFHASKIPEIEDKNRELKKGFKEDYGGNPRYSMNDMLKTISDYGYQNKSGLPQGFRTKYGLDGTETGIRNVLNEYLENLKSLDFSKAELNKSIVSTNKLSTTDLSGGGNSDGKKSALQKAEEKYAQSLREIDARRALEKLSETEYYKAVDELGKSMLIEAKASGDKEILNSDYIKMLEDVMAHPLYSKAQDELEQAQKNYATAIELAIAKHAEGLLSDDEYRKAIVDAAVSAADAALSIEGIGDAADGFVEKVKGVAVSMIEKPVLSKSDTTFDYKKNDVDKASGELDVWKKYRDDLQKAKDEGKGLSKELQEDLDKAIKNIPSLEEALKFAEIKEDVKQFSKELDESLYSGVKDIAGSADRVVGAFQNLRDVMNDVDASGWEQIMAIWNTLTNVVDSFLSICKMIESVTELTERLSAAKQVEAAIDTAVTTTKVANASIGAGADIAAATVKKATAAANVTASTAEGAADAGKGAAKLPFPWNIIAIGGAIAAAIAAFALIPKFATGGIVGGNSPNGDKILARLNSGEMVLNKGQQSTLSDAIDSQRAGSGGGSGVVVSGTSKVKGDDIYLSLSNHVKRTGKKSPWK